MNLSAFVSANRVRATVFALIAAPAFAQTAAPVNPPGQPSYFEFGTVVALGQRSVDIQTFDQQKQRLVQHSFALARETRADVVHVGDTVEVIFTSANNGLTGDWTARRVVVLNTGIPKPGPPTGDHREVPSAVGVRIAPPPSGARVPAPTAPVVRAVSKGSAAAPAASSVAFGGGSNSSAKAPAPGSVALANSATGSAKAPSAGSVDLGSAAKPKPAAVIEVPLGASAVEAKPAPFKTKEVAREMPLAECNRSSADWPAQPLRLAVLDFRYPTEREEAHDVGTTGGGSGTAVADLVYARLDQLNVYAMSRGDRTRLYKADFAGAARVGRELGVDAVLAGTFKPMDPPPGSDPDFPPPKTYELSAGIVDTCTGQLLLRLISVSCPDGLDPNAAANAASCKPFAVTAKQATDPKDQAHAFQAPIDTLLYPLEHNGPPPGSLGSAGVVTAASNGAITIKLPAGSQLKAGDQVAVHAWGLTKNPTTYTLHNLHDEEIGRVTISNVHGNTATGTFIGDFPPHPGDTAELVPE